MNRVPTLRLELVATLVAFLMIFFFSFFIVRAVNQINDGQLAVVCILAISPTERTAADVTKCLNDNNLGAGR